MFGEEVDFWSPGGKFNGDFRGVAGCGVAERVRVRGRVREAAPYLQSRANRKLLYVLVVTHHFV